MTSPDALVPDPLSSDRQYERYYHYDLAGMETGELLDELHALRPLLWGLPADHWLRERVKALEAEISKRKGTTGHEFRSQPKPKPAEGVKLE